MSTDAIPTRESLLLHLKDWSDEENWRAFFDTYWRLIYNLAIKAGLNDAEAQEVLQETVISVAKQMPTFEYDRNKGSFKGWLLQITRRRIVDEFRKRTQHAARQVPLPADSRETSMIERLPDPATSDLEKVWEAEWKANLLEVARERIKNRVSAKHLEIFERYVLRNEPVRDVARATGVSAAQVYWVKHTVSGMLRKEIQALEQEPL